MISTSISSGVALPRGPAGGDLSGTYPNPTVAQVNGAAVPASKTIVGTNSSSQIVDASSATLSNNTTGTAANLSGTPALPSGTTATTQSAQDGSTDIATDAYADALNPIASKMGLFTPVMKEFVAFNDYAAAAISASANAVYIVMVHLEKPIKFNKMVWNLTTEGAAGELVDFGFYSIAGSLLGHTGAQNARVSTGMYTVSLGTPFTLQPGEYYFAFTSNNTTAASYFYNESSAPQGLKNANGNRYAVAANTSTAGVLPNSLGSPSTQVGYRSGFITWWET